MLSTASGGEERCPIVQRIILSRERIQEKDLNLVRSALLFNYSNIPVCEEDLERLGSMSGQYKQITEYILASKKNKSVFFLNEQDDVYHYANLVLNDRIAALEYVSCLRGLSFSHRYNKVSYKTDHNLVDLLRSRGYYQDAGENGVGNT